MWLRQALHIVHAAWMAWRRLAHRDTEHSRRLADAAIDVDHALEHRFLQLLRPVRIEREKETP
jgi:hypothetical protein